MKRALMIVVMIPVLIGGLVLLVLIGVGVAFGQLIAALEEHR